MALVAVDVLGLSYGQAAKALGVPEPTIATRVYRARDKVARSVSGISTSEQESVLMKATDDQGI
jgi:DNA-directed RNA polymerase specialized sigma24 family protein